MSRQLKLLKILATALALVAAFTAAAAGQVYVFEERAAVPEFRPASMHAELEAEGLKLAATKPADQDASGSWGFPNQGYQASVRMRKSTFVVGEPVIAWVIMRNTSSTSMLYHVSVPDLAWDIALTTDKGRLRPKDQEERIIQGGYNRILRSSHQILHIFSLGATYDLSVPGKYYVTFTRTFSYPGQPEKTQVTTGTAAFQILEGTNVSPRSNASSNGGNPSNAPPVITGVQIGGAAALPPNSQPSVSPTSAAESGKVVQPTCNGTRSISTSAEDSGSGARLALVGLGALLAGVILVLLVRRRKA